MDIPSINSFKTKLQRTLWEMLPAMTADQLDEKAETGDTVLINDFPYQADLKMPELKGGWVCQYVGPRRQGRYGKVILLPNEEHPRACWRKGQVNFAIRHGLSEAHAERWMQSHLQAKHEVLAAVADVLQDPEKTRIYLTYDAETDEAGYNKWVVRGGRRDDLSMFRRRAMVLLLRELTAPPKEKKKKQPATKKSVTSTSVNGDVAVKEMKPVVTVSVTTEVTADNLDADLSALDDLDAELERVEDELADIENTGKALDDLVAVDPVLQELRSLMPADKA